MNGPDRMTDKRGRLLHVLPVVVRTCEAPSLQMLMPSPPYCTSHRLIFTSYTMNLLSRTCRIPQIHRVQPIVIITVRSFSHKKVEEPFYGFPRPLSDSFQPSPYHHLPTPTVADPSKTNSSWVLPTTTTLQRLGVAIHSATTAFSNPERADAVAALGEITGHVALRACYDKMMLHPTGQRILRDRPLIHTSSQHHHLNVQYLSTVNPNKDGKQSFGQAYATFMQSHHFNPDDRAPIRYISDPDLAYIMLRYRQCHDFWHTLSGLPPTILGELALKWVELLQTGLPVAALSATVGSLRLSGKERQVLFDTYVPWAIHVGEKATFLLNVYYEEEMNTDIDELRSKLNFEPAPTIVP